MKQKIKQTISCGIIKGDDLIKSSSPRQEITFKTGGYITDKDRPRKRIKPRDFRKDDW